MGKTEDIINKAVRDITRAGVYRSPKSKVREIVRSALNEMARELVGAVGEEKFLHAMTPNGQVTSFQDSFCYGYNEARQSLIEKAREMGINLDEDV